MFTDLAPAPSPDVPALLDCLLRKSTPRRVHHMELFLDGDVKPPIMRRFGLDEGIERNAPFAYWKQEIRLQRFLGYEYVYGVADVQFPRGTDLHAADTTEGETSHGTRTWFSEHTGPIACWDDFERYPWPDPAKMDLSAAEWLEKNLPDDMCMTAAAHSVFEQLSWLIGLEIPGKYKLDFANLK